MKAKLITFVRGLSNGTPPRFQSYLKSLTLILTLLLSVNAWGVDVTAKWTATSGGLGTGIGSGTITDNQGNSWSYTRTLISGASYTGWNPSSSGCIQLGKNGGVENLTISTSDISGTIKSVLVECSSAGGNHKVGITVGSTTYLSPTATASWETVNSKGKNSGGTSSGTITISITEGTKAFYIKSFTVVYTAVSRTVAWKVNGESYTEGNPTTQVDNGSKVSTLPTAPTTDCGGKVFVGWTATENYTHATDAPSDLFNTTAKAPRVLDNVTYYAVFADQEDSGDSDWEKVTTVAGFTPGTYVFGYESNEGFIPMRKETDKTTINVNTYLRAGTTAGSSSASTLSLTAETDVTAYAVTIGAGSAEGTITIHNGTNYIGVGSTSGSIHNEETSEDWKPAISNDVLILKHNTSDIYIFSYNTNSPRFAAYTSSQGKPSFYKWTRVFSYSNYATSCAPPSKCANPTFSVAGGTYTEAKSVTLSCSTDGATIYYTTNGNTPSASSTPYTGAITVNQDMTIKAIATKSGLDNSEVVSASYTINYTVTFNMMGHGSAIAALTSVKYNTSINSSKPADPSVLGYDFGGWYKENTCTNAWNWATDKVTGNITLYAKWTAKQCDLIFDKNDAEAEGSMAQQSFTFNETKALTTNAFTRAHKNFTGWATTSDGAKAYNDGANYTMTTEGATLYAVWAWKQTTITLDKDGGSGGYSNVTATYGSAMPNAGNAPTKTGYDFNGYYTGQNGTGTQYYSSTNTSVQNWDKDDASLTLYAYWTPKTITITLAANGHSDADGSFIIVYGTKAASAFTAVTPHTGYTVRGYYTGSACTGAIVVNPDGTLGGQLNNWIDAEGNWIKSSDGTLYAGYTPDKHTVAWVVNGNSWTGKGGSTKADYDSRVASVPTPPTTNDCDFMKVFVGWTATEIDGTTDTKPTDLFTDAAGAPVITGDATYYAVFATADESTTDYAIGTLADLQTGKKVLILSNDEPGEALSSEEGGSAGYLKIENVTITNDVISNPKNTIIWNVTKDNTNKYSFNQGADKILNMISGGNMYANSTSDTWTIGQYASTSSYQMTSTNGAKYFDRYGASGFKGYGNSSSSNKVDFYLPATDYSEYATTCVECTNVITISKGEEVEHGSYSLSKTGDVCLSNIPGETYSVTVTATPDEHYHLATVSTSSGTAGEVVDNTCVVSGITASTTLTAVFEEDPKVTVTWHKGASATETTSNVYVGTLYSAISEYAPTVADNAAGDCADKFMGWATASISDISGVDEEDVVWVTDDYEIDNTHKDIYAVFAKGSDGGTGSVVLSYTSLGLRTGYESGSTKTVSDIDFYCDNVMTGASGQDGYHKIQFRKSADGVGYIYNSEAMPGNITSIVLGSTTQNVHVYFGTSSNPNSNEKTCTSSSLTATPSGNYEYFKIINNATTSTTYVGTITINYSSVSYSNYVTSCEAPVVWTVEGNFGEGWKDYDITDGQVVINNLAKNSSYDFKVHKTVGTSHDHYGATGDDNKYTTSGTNWTLNGTYNVHLKTAASGTYTIHVSNLTETHPQISVTYPTAYTITFDGHGDNGGSTAAMTNLAMGEVINLTANGFYKDCKNFLKWTTNQDGTGTEYTNKQPVTINGNMTLYAQWTPKRYDAIYDANGITGYTGELPATVTYDCGDQVTVSQTPRLSKFGYTFIGWNTNPSATTALPDNYQFTIDQGDTRIYAIWEAKKPTLISIAPADDQWSVKKGNSVQMNLTMTPDPSELAEENREVTWSSSNATLAFVNQEGYVSFVGAGSATITATSKVDGSVSGSYSFTINNTCDGLRIHAFGDGYLQDDYFHKVGDTHEWRCSYVLKNGVDKFWVGDCNNWQSGHSADQSFNDIPLRDYRTVKTNPSQDLIGTLVIWDDSSDPNYYICFEPTYMISYMTDASNWRIMEFHPTSTAYSYETELLQVPEGYKNNSDMKYYVGLKKANGDNVSIYNKSRQDAMNGVSGLSSADIAGKYGKWHISTNSGDMNWYCTFNRYYQVRFEMNGGDGNIDPMYFYANDTESFNTNTLTNPTKTGYELTGWKDQDNTTYTTSESITVTKDLVLTAQWTARNYTITFDKNGGNADGGATATYDNGTLTSVTHVSRTGYDLNGYYTAASDGKMIVTAAGTLVANQSDYTDPDGNWKKAENCTLYAQWTAKQYTVTLDNQEATTAGATEVTATYDAAMPSIAGNLPAKTGYDFGGYYDGIDGAGTQYYNNTGASAHAWDKTAGATLYAKWTPSVYTISYKDQGGGDYSGSNLASLPTSHTYNTATDLVAGVKDGARFEGWYKNAGCTEGPVTTLGATEYTGNITLYAKWTAVYAITYIIPTDGGTLATGAQTSAASGETVTMPGLQGGNQVPAPYDCEELIGWTTSSAAYESKTGAMPDPFYAVGATSPVISGATTFYAVYSRPGAGGTGSAELNNTAITAWLDEVNKTSYGGDAVSKTVDSKTWTSNGILQRNTGGIQIRDASSSPTVYVQTPVMGGNISTIKITYKGVSSSYRTIYINSSASTTNAISQQIHENNTYSGNEVTINCSSLSSTQLYIMASTTFKIEGLLVSYGAPSIISTKLNCNTDILSFEVTYDANTTEFPDATTTCTSDTHTFNGDDPETNPYTICSSATCEGMTFVGWNNDQNGKGSVNWIPGTPITNVHAEEFTMYAQFAYNVNVKDNDDLQENVHPSERGGSIDLNGGYDVCSPAKYDFIGWTTDNPDTWKQTITSPTIFSSEGVTTYTPTAVGTQVTAVYGMSTSVGSQAFYISYNGNYLKFNGESRSQTTVEAEATAMYRETINSSENKYHLYYMNSGVKTYFYHSSDLMVDDENPGASYGWVITTNGAGVSTFQSIYNTGRYLSHNDSQFTTHALGNKKPLTITTGAKEYKYYDETTCTDEITITFNAGGGTMDPVTTQIVGHTGTTITVPTCSYPGWNFLGWVNTNATTQSDIKIADNQIYTNADGHKYTIGTQSETLYAYYTKTPEPPVFDGNISDVWKIYVPVVVDAEYVDYYEVGAKDIINPSAHGEYTTTTRCIDGTNWAFTNVGTNQFTIQNLAGLYLRGDPAGDKNDIYFSTNPSVWTMENKGDGFYKFVNQNTLNRYLAFQLNNGAPTFINTSTQNEGNPDYSFVKIGGCADPVYTTSPGGEFKLNMLGNVRVTSTNNKTVRSVDALSISADNLTPNTAITLSADPAVLTFCDATGAALSLTTDGTGKLDNTAVYVKYTPTAYNTTSETPTITATCGEQHQDFAGLVTGRSLPEKFIIAQKVGDDWYALPNDMSNTQTNPAAVKISAVNETTGTATIYSDVTNHLAYQLQAKGASTGIAFSSPIKGDNIIKAHNVAERNTIGLYAQSSWSGQDVKYYEFTPVTSDLVDYTLQNVFQTNYLGITDGNWGVYSDAATVRFLAIDQQPAATITWQNEMLGTQHAQNAAEDGVITLPTGAAPVACERAIAAGWVFFGWGDQIGTTKTATPPILVGGEVAKADKTYYAIFRRGTENVWRTSCPTVNTITYKANGGEGTDHVVYTELTTATAITVETAGFTKEGSQFIGWTVAGSEDNLIQPGGTISGINSDIIVNAQWMGNLVISGDVRLTSAVGQKVATAATGITFSSTDMSYATELRITYRDETNEIDYPRSGDHSYTSSEFRLCDDSYHVADNSNISLAGVTGAYERTYSISYIPNGNANTLDHYTMKVEVLHSSTVIATVTKDLYGRTLPEKFAIVAHVGDMWYALPNNMANSSTYAPVAVSVNNSDASILNWTATGAKTAGYSMKQMTVDYNKLRFASKFDANEYCLWASENGSTGIRNWSATETGVNYRWTVTPQDANFQAYTLRNENNGRTLRLDGTQTWGMYAGGGTNVVYFIPLTDMEVADFQVIEWFANKVLIETNNQTINTSAAKTSVGSGEYADATVNGTTYGTNQYTLTTGDLTTSAGKSLNIRYQTTAGDAWYMNSVKVPIIVSQGEYTTSESVLGGLDKSKHQDNDLVVRDGATLTMDATTGTWNQFKNVTIYPTSKVVVPAEKTLSTATTTLFGGIDEIYDGSAYNMTTYAVPQLVLKGNLTHSATVQGLRYDIRVNNAIYYDFALPYESMYELVTDHKGAYDYKYWVKDYDGATRATVAGHNGWVYYDWDADPWKINICTGYLLAAQSKVNQNYVIMRHPMGYYNTGDDKYAKNPNGHQSGQPEETKAAVNVYAHPSTHDNNAGWNFIANPFMANFQLDQDGEGGGIIQTGKLKEHKVNEKWDGHYEWDTSDGKNVRYVTTYSYETGEYTQHKMSETALPPFTGFFVQIAKDGQIVFDISGRADAAPARMLSDDELPSEIEITLKVNGQNESDETVMLLTKDLSRSNAREFPDEQTKMVNDGILNYYTYGGEDTKMYANGMSYEEGQEWNKAGIMVKTAGEYSFSVDGVNKNYVEQVVLRDMDSNTEYDLMSTDAKIYLDKGEMNDRFYVKVVFGKHNIGTGNGEMYDNRAPEKFILNDHMYIRANGVLFDGVGKRVK